jgi:hypothetical protein
VSDARPQIELCDLSKVYRVHEREAGAGASVRSLFRRKYKEVRAVEGVSFTVAPGEIVGFLGPNGAGKTTTLKMLAGLLHPSGGEARVLGRVPWRRERELLRNISLVMGNRNQLLWDIPAMDSFLVNQAVYQIPESSSAKRSTSWSRFLTWRPAEKAGARPEPRRADEVRAGRGAAAPALGAVPGRADARRRPDDAKPDPPVRADPQRPPRGHRAADQPLHGRRHRAVPPRDRDPQGPAPVRRRAGRPGRPDRAVQAGAHRPERAGRGGARGALRRGDLPRRRQGDATPAARADVVRGRAPAVRAAGERPDRRGPGDRGGH